MLQADTIGQQSTFSSIEWLKILLHKQHTGSENGFLVNIMLMHKAKVAMGIIMNK
jgi:hypothetical protein